MSDANNPAVPSEARPQPADPSQVHTLKTWPEYFKAVTDGTKRFEIRKDDRNFRVGDCLVLQEYDPLTGNYTGEMVSMRVTYLTFDFTPEGMCVMSIEPWEADPFTKYDVVVRTTEKSAPGVSRFSIYGIKADGTRGGGRARPTGASTMTEANQDMPPRGERDIYGDDEGSYMWHRCYACGHRLRFASDGCPQCGIHFVDGDDPPNWPELCDCERCKLAREKGV